MRLIDTELEFSWLGPNDIKLYFNVEAKMTTEGAVHSFDYEVSGHETDDKVYLNSTQLNAIDYLVETKLIEDFFHRADSHLYP